MTTATITRADIPALTTYRAGREDYVRKMIAYKRARRVRLSADMSLLFENKNTVLFQILELVHNEDLTDTAELDEYIEIYSGMLPGEDELSATLFIETDEQERLQTLLGQLIGIEKHLHLEIGGERVQAVFEEEHDDRDVTTSVHYLKFPLTGTAKAYLANGSTEHEDVRLVLTHPNLSLATKLGPETIASLANDL